MELNNALQTLQHDLKCINETILHWESPVKQDELRRNRSNDTAPYADIATMRMSRASLIKSILDVESMIAFESESEKDKECCKEKLGSEETVLKFPEAPVKSVETPGKPITPAPVNAKPQGNTAKK